MCRRSRANNLYRAAATPRIPTTPAKLPNKAAVAFGTPPVEVAEAVAADADPPPLVAVAAAVEAAEPSEEMAEVMELTSPDTAVSPETLYVWKKDLTFAGSAEYHAGVEPALKALANELAWEGSASAVITDEGTPVSRTERIDWGGRSFSREVATLSKLESAAELDGSDVTPARDALENEHVLAERTGR